MKTTFRMTVMAAALGMMSGLAAAQEQGATTAAEPAAATTATQVDNGAMPGDSHVRIVRLSDVKGTLRWIARRVWDLSRRCRICRSSKARS